MPTTLFTFLGKGTYECVRYHLDPSTDEGADGGRREAQPSKFVARAIAELCAAERVVVFATDEAWNKHGADLSAQLDVLSGKQGLRHERCRIPDGKSQEELDEMFRCFIAKLEEAIPPGGKHEAADAEAGGDRKGDRILIDITHGFRAQGFLAGAAISLSKAVRADWPETKILYGAFDAKDETVSPPLAPLWDITAFLDLIDWAQALRLFLKTGRAEEAAKRAEALGHSLRRKWAQEGRRGREPTLKAFAQALEQFSRAFSTVRTGDLLLKRPTKPCRSLADELLHLAEESKGEIQKHLPALATILEELIEMLKPLTGSPPHLAGPGHAPLVAALAQLYQRFERPLQAAATLREGYVNLVAPQDAARPGKRPFDEKARKEAENIALALFPAYKNELSNLRNDLLHAGYRRDPVSPEKVMASLERAREAFEQAAGRRGDFVNVSNHPSADWPESQRRAAEALGRRIRDFPFPEVPPDADEEWIRKSADKLAETIIVLTPDAALVQGEYTLAFALVARLEAAGIPCYAAATPRLAEKKQDEEENATVRRFRFTRLRRYYVQT